MHDTEWGDSMIYESHWVVSKMGGCENETGLFFAPVSDSITIAIFSGTHSLLDTSSARTKLGRCGKLGASSVMYF